MWLNLLRLKHAQEAIQSLLANALSKSTLNEPKFGALLHVARARLVMRVS
jgi:hypothetical protein